MLHDEHAQVEPFTHPADQVREPFALAVVGAGGRLVEQQQRGVRDERPAQLDQLLEAEGQRGYHAVAMAREAKELEHFVRTRRRAGFVRADPAQAQAITDRASAHHRVLADQQVPQCRHAATELNVLERARDAEADDLVRPRAGDVAILETDGPALGLVEPADAVEDRGLPRSVRSDEPDDLAGVDREVDAVDGDESSDADREAGDLQERSAHLTPLPSPSSTICSARGARSRRRAAERCRKERMTPAKPCGRNAIVRMRIAPRTTM